MQELTEKGVNIDQVIFADPSTEELPAEENRVLDQSGAPILKCGQLQLLEHVHGDNCYTVIDTEGKLVSQLGSGSEGAEMPGQRTAVYQGASLRVTAIYDGGDFPENARISVERIDEEGGLPEKQEQLSKAMPNDELQLKALLKVTVAGVDEMPVLAEPIRLIVEPSQQERVTAAAWYDNSDSLGTSNYGINKYNGQEEYKENFLKDENGSDTEVKTKRYAFGNNNAGTKYGGEVWNGYNLNQANASSYGKCTYDIVQGIASNGNVIFNAGIDGPNLFGSYDNENNDKKEWKQFGRTDYDNSKVTFERHGDTYTLISAEIGDSTNSSLSSKPTKPTPDKDVDKTDPTIVGGPYDYNVGDMIPYVLKATVPVKDLGQFVKPGDDKEKSTYKLTFRDYMDEGLLYLPSEADFHVYYIPYGIIKISHYFYFTGIAYRNSK
jgi:hypothetical protein